MDKFILLSVIFASIAIPARFAKVKNPRAGLKKTLVWMAVFNVFYLFLVRFFWGR